PLLQPGVLDPAMWPFLGGGTPMCAASKPSVPPSASAWPLLATFTRVVSAPIARATGVVGAIEGSAAASMLLPAIRIVGFHDPDEPELRALVPWIPWLLAA